MMMMTPSRKTPKVSNLQISHQIVSVAILNFLMRWSFCQRRCVRMGVLSVPWMRRNQSHVSDLFILNFAIIVFVLLKLCFLSASFIPCSPLAVHASSVISRI
jgi:hypothetical protein